MSKFFNNILALFDANAWLLIAPVLVILFAIDPAMAKTMVQWSLYMFVLCGMVIIISRIMFPQIDLSRLVANAASGNAGAGLVVLGLMFFLGMFLLAIAGWSKP